MSDESYEDENSIDPELAALLGDEATWEMPDLDLEDAIVAAISSEASSIGAASTAAVTPISAARRWRGPLLAGVAAAVLLIVGLAVVLFDDAAAPGEEVVLEATERAPDSAGVVRIDETPLGTRLILQVEGLPPAAPGQYYEAWLRTGPDVGVSAGTFHLRGGDGEIELWAGVTVDDYPLFTITVQDEADPLSSGRVVLKGLVDR